ncbi:MAG: pseudouridine synthase, partial [Thermofilum sp. ex4484_79]
VVNVDPEIRAGEEVLVVDEEDRLLAIGRAVLAAQEMLSFKRGIAVKVRRGVKKQK